MRLKERLSELFAVSLSLFAGLGTAYSIGISYYGVFRWALPLFILLFDVPAIYLVGNHMHFLSAGQVATLFMFLFVVVFLAPCVGIYKKMDYIVYVFWIDMVLMIFLAAAVFIMIKERKESG